MNSKNSNVQNMEFLANALCLDFINTIEYRVPPNFDPVNDFLQDTDSILIWGKRIGIISKNEGEKLGQYSLENPKESESIRLKIIDLRELLYKIFSPIALRKKPEEKDLKELSSILTRYAKERVIVYRKSQMKWDWSKDSSFEIILAKLAYSGEALLLSGDLSRIRQCPATNCGWLFLDTSKNGKRRWCDMEDCGNKVKAKKHYARSKKGDAHSIRMP